MIGVVCVYARIDLLLVGLDEPLHLIDALPYSFGELSVVCCVVVLCVPPRRCVYCMYECFDNRFRVGNA